MLFMNDQDRRIVLYDPRSHALETMITGAITAPYRVPGERAGPHLRLQDLRARERRQRQHENETSQNAHGPHGS